MAIPGYERSLQLETKLLRLEEKKLYFSVWAKAIDTQMHFNDMSARARQFGLGFVVASLSFGVILLGQNKDFYVTIHFGSGFDLHASVLIVIASIISLQAVKRLDLNVYHKMLRGAVMFGEDFEQTYMKEVFDLDKGMTQAITHYSRYEDADVQMLGDRQIYTGTFRRNALEKLEGFYSLATWALILLAIIIFLTTASIGHS